MNSRLKCGEQYSKPWLYAYESILSKRNDIRKTHHRRRTASGLPEYGIAFSAAEAVFVVHAVVARDFFERVHSAVACFARLDVVGRILWDRREVKKNSYSPTTPPTRITHTTRCSYTPFIESHKRHLQKRLAQSRARPRRAVALKNCLLEKSTV